MASGFLQNSSGDCVRRLQQMARLADPADSGPGAADPMLSCRELQRLASMQHRVSRNYFRLLEADRELRARASGTPKTMGALLEESLEAERQRLGRASRNAFFPGDAHAGDLVGQGKDIPSMELPGRVACGGG